MPNHFTKAKALGLPKPEISKETREKISRATKASNAIRYADPEYRKRLSESMKLAVERNPESYGASNRGRTKRIDKHGISFQGKWELEFFEWCLDNHVEVVRPTEGFKYFWKGERTYFPDFFLPALDLFIEVKGYETERDKAKWRYFPRRLLVVRRADIEKIRRNEYVLATK